MAPPRIPARRLLGLFSGLAASFAVASLLTVLAFITLGIKKIIEHKTRLQLAAGQEAKTP